MEDSVKKNVWRNIYLLIRPYKKKLITVFVISLIATGVSLLEPLIYREAINDIAGLFVQQAKNDVNVQRGDSTVEEESPVIPFFENLMGHKDSLQNLRDTVVYTYDTILVTKDTIIVRKVKHGKLHKAALIKQKKKISQIKIVKEPHTKTYVAPRTAAQAFETLAWSVLFLFIINVLGLVFWWIGDNMNVRLSSTIERNFIQRTFGHVLHLPLSFFAKRSTAALHKQIDQSEEISGTVTYFTKDIFPELISLLGIIAIMFWQNYVLALLALSVIPVYLFLTIRSTKKLELTLAGYYEKWEEVSARMQDALAGVKTVKLSGAEEREIAQLDAEVSKAYRDYMKRSFLSNKYAFWQVFLTYLSSALVLSYGGYLALHQKLTPGDVVMFVAYLDMLYDPIDNLANIWAEVQQNVTSVARAFRLLNVQATKKDGEELKIQHGKVEFKNVTFGYNSQRRVLNNLSFVAAPGKLTAIVGSSGAGKTTTVDLLLKLYEPQHGEILIDDQQLSELDEASVRRHIGMVTADGAIFRGSLADNIRYKKTNASNEEVKAAATAAGMQTTLQRLPDGLNTIVGEGGFGLSVGERQRLQIARVIVDKPKLLILDEATANLDYATEAEVKKAISEIRKENTVIVIAHRFSMVKDADYVIVLDEGQVIEEGRPDELIANRGWFADFASAEDDDIETEATGEDENEQDIDEEEE
jgi:ATP-binding cassette, subfamily B, bacterial